MRIHVCVYMTLHLNVYMTIPVGRIMSEVNRLAKKMNSWHEKRSFKGNCEILRTIYQPRTLASDVPASQKEVYLFYNPQSLKVLEKSDLMMMANDVNNCIDWLILFKP